MVNRNAKTHQVNSNKQKNKIRTMSRSQKSAKPTIPEVIYIQLIDSTHETKTNFLFIFIYYLLINIILSVFTSYFFR